VAGRAAHPAQQQRDAVAVRDAGRLIVAGRKAPQSGQQPPETVNPSTVSGAGEACPDCGSVICLQVRRARAVRVQSVAGLARSMAGDLAAQIADAQEGLTGCGSRGRTSLARTGAEPE
jgi:hypothetical protein